MKDHSAEQRLRHYGPCYLAGAPASAGALPSKDRKNVQSAGLIHRISTRPVLCCGLTQAVIAPGKPVACSSSNSSCMQAKWWAQCRCRRTPAVLSDLLVNRAFDRDIMSMNFQLNRLSRHRAAPAAPKTIGIHFYFTLTTS